MAIYATQQHVLQGELVLLNLSCCLLEEQRLNLRRQRLKRNSTEVSITSKAAQAGPGCFRWFCGWLHQPCSPKHLPGYNLPPSREFDVSSSPIVFLSVPELRLSLQNQFWQAQTEFYPTLKSQKALSLSYSWHEVFTKRWLCTNNPFPLFTFHATKSKAFQ